MASNGCTNAFRDQFGSGRSGSHDPYLPGTSDDYSLTHMDDHSMTFSNGKGDALIFMGNDTGGTYYERSSDGTVSWTSEDGRTYEATKNPDGTYDITGSDGTELQDVELPKELTQDDPSQPNDGGGMPTPDATQVSPEQILQLMAQLHPEQVQRMVAIAQGGGRIYPTEQGGHHKPEKLEFDEGMGAIPEPRGRAGRTDPGPGSTGRHRHGRRPHGGHPVKLGDTPGVTHSAPPGISRNTSHPHVRGDVHMLFGEFADYRAALSECVRELERAEEKRKLALGAKCVNIAPHSIARLRTET